jgi:hypothetical protein
MPSTIRSIAITQILVVGLARGIVPVVVLQADTLLEPLIVASPDGEVVGRVVGAGGGTAESLSELLTVWTLALLRSRVVEALLPAADAFAVVGASDPHLTAGPIHALVDALRIEHLLVRRILALTGSDLWLRVGGTFASSTSQRAGGIGLALTGSSHRIAELGICAPLAAGPVARKLIPVVGTVAAIRAVIFVTFVAKSVAEVAVLELGGGTRAGMRERGGVLLVLLGAGLEAGIADLQPLGRIRVVAVTCVVGVLELVTILAARLADIGAVSVVIGRADTDRRLGSVELLVWNRAGLNTVVVLHDKGRRCGGVAVAFLGSVLVDRLVGFAERCASLLVLIVVVLSCIANALQVVLEAIVCKSTLTRLHTPAFDNLPFVTVHIAEACLGILKRVTARPAVFAISVLGLLVAVALILISSVDRLVFTAVWQTSA